MILIIKVSYCEKCWLLFKKLFWKRCFSSMTREMLGLLRWGPTAWRIRHPPTGTGVLKRAAPQPGPGQMWWGPQAGGRGPRGVAGRSGRIPDLLPSAGPAWGTRACRKGRATPLTGPGLGWWPPQPRGRVAWWPRAPPWPGSRLLITSHHCYIHQHHFWIITWSAFEDLWSWKS